MLGAFSPGAFAAGWVDPTPIAAATEPSVLYDLDSMYRAGWRLAGQEFLRRPLFHSARTAAQLLRLGVDSEAELTFWALYPLPPDQRPEGSRLAERLSRVLRWSLPLLQGDKDLLARALGNLVANAIEAMPEGGTLSVRTLPAPGGARVEIGDTGPGLTDDQRTRLFTPHYTTKKGGTGLGLAIVQGVVSDHGGRVEVRSEPGLGTTFTLFLPLVRPSGLALETA